MKDQIIYGNRLIAIANHLLAVGRRLQTEGQCHAAGNVPFQSNPKIDSVDLGKLEDCVQTMHEALEKFVNPEHWRAGVPGQIPENFSPMGYGLIPHRFQSPIPVGPGNYSRSPSPVGKLSQDIYALLKKIGREDVFFVVDSDYHSPSLIGSGQQVVYLFCVDGWEIETSRLLVTTNPNWGQLVDLKPVREGIEPILLNDFKKAYPHLYKEGMKLKWTDMDLKALWSPYEQQSWFNSSHNQKSLGNALSQFCNAMVRVKPYTPRKKNDFKVLEEGLKSTFESIRKDGNENLQYYVGPLLDENDGGEVRNIKGARVLLVNVPPIEKDHTPTMQFVELQFVYETADPVAYPELSAAAASEFLRNYIYVEGESLTDAIFHKVLLDRRISPEVVGENFTYNLSMYRYAVNFLMGAAVAAAQRLNFETDGEKLTAAIQEVIDEDSFKGAKQKAFDRVLSNGKKMRSNFVFQIENDLVEMTVIILVEDLPVVHMSGELIPHPDDVREFLTEAIPGMGDRSVAVQFSVPPVVVDGYLDAVKPLVRQAIESSKSCLTKGCVFAVPGESNQLLN